MVCIYHLKLLRVKVTTYVKSEYCSFFWITESKRNAFWWKLHNKRLFASLACPTIVLSCNSIIYSTFQKWFYLLVFGNSKLHFGPYFSMQIMRIWPVYLYCDLGAVLNLIYKIYFIIHEISFLMVYNVIFLLVFVSSKLHFWLYFYM